MLSFILSLFSAADKICFKVERKLHVDEQHIGCQCSLGVVQANFRFYL